MTRERGRMPEQPRDSRGGAKTDPPLHDNWREALDTADPRVTKSLSGFLIERGADAAPQLVGILREGPPNARKTAAYLLGRIPIGPDGIKTLCQAILHDSEPKVRQNAAVSLGRIGNPEAVASLAEAAGGEAVTWVRTSIVLALGAIAGEAARTALTGVVPRSSAEADALRKAVDRCSPEERSVEWETNRVWEGITCLETPPGLEEVALEEAMEAVAHPIEVAGPGLLTVSAPPWLFFPALRCIHGVRLDLYQGPPLPPDSNHLAAAIGERVHAGIESFAWRSRLRWPDRPLRYRFSVTGRKLPRPLLRSILEKVRSAGEPFGLLDSPSRYDIEVILREEDGRSVVSLRPSFMDDPRFRYRGMDVGASISPVVAAGLARLARRPGSRRILDPTCGSGTLLVERARLDRKVRLTGIDVSPTAVAAARSNAADAGEAGRITIRRGDAASAQAWIECDEVIANLPFGHRSPLSARGAKPGGTDRKPEGAPGLYAGILSNLSIHLASGGRAVLYTADRRRMEESLKRAGSRLRVERTLRVLSGGIWCGVWVLTKKS